MNLKPQGTAGTSNVLGEYYLSFVLYFCATGLGPATDGWARVCNISSMNLKPLGTAGTGIVLGEYYLSSFLHF
jgi:hypothetical protein